MIRAKAPARFVAGNPPREDNLRFVPVAPIDGDARAQIRDGRACLRTDRASGNGYLYFDVSRRWLRAHGDAPFRVEWTIEFFDEGTDAVALQYDGMGNALAQNFREIAWRRTATGTWRQRSVLVEGAELRNGQQGRADFRLAAGESDLFLAAVELRVLDASAPVPRPNPAPRPVPTPDEIRVPLGKPSFIPVRPLDAAGAIALSRFQERLKAIGAGRTGQAVALVVGQWRPELARRYPRTARLLERLAADPVAFRRRDGYVVGVERKGPETVVCAMGQESPGAAFAIGHLEAHALRDEDGQAVLRLPRLPRIEAPALERRELYLNIGYGLARPGITVEDWPIARWREYIDALALARYNAWSFFLWGDGETLHPASANRVRNRRLHETLRQAIAYSHRRGLKVGMHLSPTIVPVALWDENPELHAELEYRYPGVLCPARPAGMRLMRAVHGPEIRWFADVDFYSLWFYDVGGCFCATCRQPDRQRDSLLAQIDVFSRLAREANPRAEFQVMAWALWRYERRHGFSIRQRFVAEARRRLSGSAWAMADGVAIDPGCAPLFPEMRRVGATARAFLYQTNIETGQPFALVQSRYLARYVPEAIRSGASGVFLMRIEAGSRGIDDAVAGQFLWNPWSDPMDAILAAARATLGDVRAARLGADALARMDDFAWFGHAGGYADAVQGARIADRARQAMDAAPTALQPALEWLPVAGDAYALLGRAAQALDDEDEAALRTLDEAFSARMHRSRLYRFQADGAPYWQELFRTSLARFFRTGWAASPF